MKVVGNYPADFWQMYASMKGCDGAADRMTLRIIREIEKVGRVYSVFDVENAARVTANTIRRVQSEFAEFGAADSEGRSGLYAILREFFGESFAEKYFW